MLRKLAFSNPWKGRPHTFVDEQSSRFAQLIYPNDHHLAELFREAGRVTADTDFGQKGIYEGRPGTTVASLLTTNQTLRLVHSIVCMSALLQGWIQCSLIGASPFMFSSKKLSPRSEKQPSDSLWSLVGTNAPLFLVASAAFFFPMHASTFRHGLKGSADMGFTAIPRWMYRHDDCQNFSRALCFPTAYGNRPGDNKLCRSSVCSRT